MAEEPNYTAFAGMVEIVSGDLGVMIRGVKGYLDGGGGDRVLIFEDATGSQIDFDFRGTMDEVLARAQGQMQPQGEAVRTGPGRPKLGVVAREVTLLPRHWEWLEAQRGGASAALRRLVDEARKREPTQEQARRRRKAASHVMWSLGGDLPNFEEATRALFAPDQNRFQTLVADWPEDLRGYLNRLTREAFPAD